MEKIKEGERREAKGLEGMPYDGQQVALTRRLAETSQEMAFVLGAYMSPAAVQVHKKDKWPTHCCWCKSQLGTHDHMLWECPERPEPKPRPANPIQARLAWAATGDKDEDKATMEYMARMVREVWDQRYGPDKRRRRTEGQQEPKEEEDEAARTEGQLELKEDRAASSEKEGGEGQGSQPH